jgi:hypothetical protein
MATPGRLTELILEDIENQKGFKENFKMGMDLTVGSNVMDRLRDEQAGVRQFRKDKGLNFVEKKSQEFAANFIAQKGGEFEGITEPIAAVIKGYGYGAESLATIVDTIFGRTAEGNDPDFIIAEHHKSLTANIPEKYHESILESGSLSAAVRSKERVLNRLRLEASIQRQRGYHITRLAGQLVDLDAALIPFGFGAAKYTAMGAKSLSTAATKKAYLLNSVSTGVKSGAAAGALLGGVDAISTEGSGFDEAVIFTTLGALTGGIMGAGTGVLGNFMRPQYMSLGDEYTDALLRGDEKLLAKTDSSETPSQGLIPDKDLTPDTVEPSTPMIDDLGRPISGKSSEIIKESEAWAKGVGYKERREEWDDWVSKLANSKYMMFMGSRISGAVYKSKSTVLNMFGSMIIESPTGYARIGNTAASLEPVLHNRIASKLDGSGDDFKEYARLKGDFNNKKPNIVSRDTKLAMMREVMLERNARALGKETTNNPAVKSLADKLDAMYDEAFDILNAKGLNPEKNAVDGFQNRNTSYREHYQPMLWNSNIAKIIKSSADKKLTRRAIEKGLANNYKFMNPNFDDVVSMAIAKAVVKRSLDNADGTSMDMSVRALLTGDGRENLERTLRELTDMSDEGIQGLMKTLGEGVTEKSKISFAKKRNDLDLSAEIALPNGTKIQVVDLIDNDIYKTTQQYARKTAGASALARYGIRNTADRNAFIAAAMADQKRLGINDVTENELRAMFSAFDGGSVKGVSTLTGDTLEDQGFYVSAMKRMTNIAWLDALGQTQLIETGAILTQYGMASFFQRGIKPLFDKALRENRKQLLEEISWITGKLGKEHEFMAPHLMLDELNPKEAGFIKNKIQEYGGNLSYIQSFLSGFNHVRGWQQTTAALGASDKLFRQINKAMKKDGTLKLSKKQRARILDDFGVDDVMLTKYAELLKNGTVKMRKSAFGNQFVDELNLKDWTPELREEFAPSMIRSVNQSVQKSMIGEQDPFLFTKAGGLMTHLITFPMQAFSKQAIRHLKHRDMEALTGVLYTLSTAMAVSYMKDALTGKERPTSEHVARGIAYSNMLGWVPLVADPIGTLLGIDEMRFNKYTDQAGLTPPAIKMLENAYRLPGSFVNFATGNANYNDMASMRTLPFTNLIGLGTIFNSFGTRNTGADDSSSSSNINYMDSMKNLGEIYSDNGRTNIGNAIDDYEGMKEYYRLN